MSIDLDLLAQASRAVLTALSEQERHAQEQEAEAKALLAKWQSVTTTLIEKRRIIEEAHRIQIEFLQLPQYTDDFKEPKTEQLIPKSSLMESKKRRARIGPQRFWVLQSLEAHVSADIASLARYAGVEVKRVKDLVRSDVPEGIIEEIGPDHTLFDPLESETQYTLTAEGEDLLNRFKAYKKAKGEPLPSREDAGRDETDLENTEADEMDSGKVPSTASEKSNTPVIDWNNPQQARAG